MDCEVISLAFPPGALKAAMPDVRSATKKDPYLRGIFTTDFGNINEVKLLRVLDGASAPQAESRADPHGSLLMKDLGGTGAVVRADRYTLAPFSPIPQPDVHGDVYELREYVVRAGKLDEVMEAWRSPFIWRAQLSTSIVVMHSTSGEQVRLAQIWAYRDYGHRTLVRKTAAESGRWPPPGGAGRWLSQTTIALLPDAESPLR